jgi:hypothetical protein
METSITYTFPDSSSIKMMPAFHHQSGWMEWNDKRDEMSDGAVHVRWLLAALTPGTSHLQVTQFLPQPTAMAFEPPGFI